MKKWILKAVVQKTISLLPYKHRLNYFFQKHVTKGVNLSNEYFEDRLSHAKDHLKSYRAHTSNSFPNTTLELGTGWYPVVPISMFLSGANQIFTIDISPLTDKNKILTTLQKFIEYRDQGILDKYLIINEERWKQMISICKNESNIDFTSITKALNIQYLVVDARQLTLPSDSIDLVTSNNTFEHIYPEILTSILKELQRVSKPNGIMSHFIDMSDHFAHFDRSITIYNFLRFSDSEWKIIDNSVQPQNRLRIDDYCTIYKGLNIRIIEESNRPGSIDDLRKIKPNQKFSKATENRNAISHSLLISKK